MSIFDRKPGGFLDRANSWMTPERAIAFQGLGMGLSQLAQGQTPNMSPALAALQKRQQNAQQREILQKSGILSTFTPEQQEALSMMEPSAAQSIIMQAMFAPEPQRETKVVGNVLVDAQTGQPIYQAPQEAPKPILVNGQLVDPNTMQVVGDFRDEQPSETSFIASGEALAEYGIPDDGRAYQITVTPGGVQAKAVGGGGVTVELNTAAKDQNWGEPDAGFVWLRGEDGQVITEPDPSGRGVRPVQVPKAGSKMDVDVAQTKADSAASIEQAQAALDLIRSVKNSPDLESITGVFQGNLPAGIPGVTGGQSGADLNARIMQLQGQAFLQAFESLKGGGQITQIEGEKATNAIARLQRAQSARAYREALSDLEDIILIGIRRAQGETVTQGDDNDPLGLLD